MAGQHGLEGGPAVLHTPEQGARTSIYVASAPELESITGAYFAESLPAPTNRQAIDMTAAARLWDASKELLQGR